MNFINFLIKTMDLRLTRVMMGMIFLSLGLPTRAQGDMTLRRGAAVTIFSSIGGAILGLSTLPFYEKPQDHTGNINLGALLGLIGGGGYVAYHSIDSAKSDSGSFSQSVPSKLKINDALVFWDVHPKSTGFTLVWRYP